MNFNDLKMGDVVEIDFKDNTKCVCIIYKKGYTILHKHEYIKVKVPEKYYNINFGWVLDINTHKLLREDIDKIKLIKRIFEVKKK